VNRIGCKGFQVIAMKKRLHLLLGGDHDSRLSRRLRRIVQNPLNPTTAGGRLRVNPLVLLLSGITLVTFVTFLVFSFACHEL
jgi:hypothetical protein